MLRCQFRILKLDHDLMTRHLLLLLTYPSLCSYNCNWAFAVGDLLCSDFVHNINPIGISVSKELVLTAVA